MHLRTVPGRTPEAKDPDDAINEIARTVARFPDSGRVACCERRRSTRLGTGIGRIDAAGSTVLACSVRMPRAQPQR
jgi:hypothetical protein